MSHLPASVSFSLWPLVNCEKEIQFTTLLSTQGRPRIIFYIISEVLSFSVLLYLNFLVLTFVEFC